MDQSHARSSPITRKENLTMPDPTIQLKLQPFRTPNFVLPETPPGKLQDGFKTGSSFPLSQLPAETLSDMCDAFRDEVFKKAGKDDPKR